MSLSPLELRTYGYYYLLIMEKIVFEDGAEFHLKNPKKIAKFIQKCKDQNLQLVELTSEEESKYRFTEYPEE